MALSRSEQGSLHRALLAGDPTAPAKIAEALLEPLVRALKISWRHLDPHDVEEQAIQSLMNYFGAPQRFDPSKSALLTYLRMDANGDLTNAYRAASRRKEIHLADVELDPSDRNNAMDEAYEHRIEELESERRLDQRLAEAFPDPRDRKIVELLRDGVRSTSEYALVLDCADLEPEAQAKVVQRAKDRIKKKLNRTFPS